MSSENTKIEKIIERLNDELAIADKKVECPQTLNEVNQRTFWEGARDALKVALNIVKGEK